MESEPDFLQIFCMCPGSALWRQQGSLPLHCFTVVFALLFPLVFFLQRPVISCLFLLIWNISRKLFNSQMSHQGHTLWFRSLLFSWPCSCWLDMSYIATLLSQWTAVIKKLAKREDISGGDIIRDVYFFSLCFLIITETFTMGTPYFHDPGEKTNIANSTVEERHQ